MRFTSEYQPDKKGRPTGTKNKNTRLTEAILNHLIDSGYNKFNRELNKLEGKEYIDVMVKLSSRLPKASKKDLLKSEILLFNHLKERINETSK
jgi:hypothetical protein